MAAVQCIKSYSQKLQVTFTLTVGMKEKFDLSDFDPSVIVGARQAG